MSLKMCIRDRRIFKQVDLIAAEDTRHTLQLLRALEIQKPLLSLHEHNEQKRIEEIARLLEEGKDIALVSDAGTPCISDPGARLVQALGKKKYTIVPIPGPSAVITALSATGLTQGGFSFYGFLPVKGKERKQILARIHERTQTVVLYESPHKLLKTLEDLSLYCENPLVCICLLYTSDLVKQRHKLHLVEDIVAVVAAGLVRPQRHSAAGTLKRQRRWYDAVYDADGAWANDHRSTAVCHHLCLFLRTVRQMNGQQRFIQQSLLFQPGHRTHAVTHFHLRGFPISLLGVHVYARISFLGQLINAFEQITAYKIRPLRAKQMCIRDRCGT